MVTEGKVAVARSADGKVRGSPAHPSATLEAGDLAAITSDGRVRIQHGIAPEPYVAWSHGRLVFDDTPLAEVLAQISRWYDVDAPAADSIAARRRLTASYSTESLADILPLIAASLDLRVERHGRAIMFHAKGALPAGGAS
jgi:transmembrane sensor